MSMHVFLLKENILKKIISMISKSKFLFKKKLYKKIKAIK